MKHEKKGNSPLRTFLESCCVAFKVPVPQIIFTHKVDDLLTALEDAYNHPDMPENLAERAQNPINFIDAIGEAIAGVGIEFLQYFSISPNGKLCLFTILTHTESKQSIFLNITLKKDIPQLDENDTTLRYSWSQIYHFMFTYQKILLGLRPLSLEDLEFTAEA